MRFRSLVFLLLVSVSPAATADGLKNLQVLPKSTTKDQIKAIMKAQSKALDVECDHCHAVPDMSSDENPTKKIARQMMKMTAEINEHWLKGMKDAEKNHVTCGTCHQGQKVPAPFASK